jgi:hypothetical protein
MTTASALAPHHLAMLTQESGIALIGFQGLM